MTMTSYLRMTREDMVRILGITAAIDGRTWADDTGVRATAAAWHETLRRALGRERFGVDYPLAEAAVYAHYGRETRRIMPADILDRAAEIREKRLSGVRLPLPPPELAGDPRGEQAAMAAAQDAIVAGGGTAEVEAAMAAVAADRRRVLDGGPAS